MEKKKKLLLISPSPIYSEDMLVVPQIDIYKNLVDFDVCWLLWGNKGTYEDKNLYYDKIKLLIQDIERNNKYLSGVTNSIKRYFLIKKILQTGIFNIIVIRNSIPDCCFCILNNKKYIFMLSNPIDQEYQSRRFKRSIYKIMYWCYGIYTFISRLLLCHLSSGIITISELSKNDLVRYGISSNKVFVLSESIDVSKFCPNRNELISFSEKYVNDIRLLYIGTLAKERNIDILLHVIRKLIAYHRNIKLQIVGFGDGEDQLKNTAKLLQIEQHIIFTGFLPHKYIPKIIQESDICMSIINPTPYYRKSSPIKFYEYLAMGKPTIANIEINEHKEIIEKYDCGYLVDFSIEGILNGIIEIIGSPTVAQKRASNAVSFIHNKCSMSVKVRGLNNYLLSNIKGKIHE